MLVSIAALALLGLERFAHYALRGEVLSLLSERGLELDAAEALRRSMAPAPTILTLLFALVAVAVPRIAIAVLGLLLASAGMALCFLGDASTVEKGLWLALAGSGVFKAVSLSLCVEFASSQRLKVGLLITAYAVMNLGSMLGTSLTGHEGTRLSALFVCGLALLLAIAASTALAVRGVEPAPPLATSLKNAIGVAVLTLPAMCALWVAIQIVYSTPVMQKAPPWSFLLNSAGLACLCLGLAAGVVMSAAGWLWKLALSSMLVGTGAVAIVVAGTVVGQSHSLGECVGLLLVAAVAEASLVAMVMGTCLALVPPRLAPLTLACFSFAGIVTGGVSSLPPVLIQVCAASLLLLGVGSAVVLFLLRKPLLAPLEAPADAGSSPRSLKGLAPLIAYGSRACSSSRLSSTANERASTLRISPGGLACEEPARMSQRRR
ncbi:MAG: hypothetical protein Q8N23_26520 [Archangium sp.]|nr:hypothetical protein [Archangium sp.]MDP3570303.1 hypothetical protein [Archangium sp.]